MFANDRRHLALSLLILLLAACQSARLAPVTPVPDATGVPSAEAEQASPPTLSELESPATAVPVTELPATAPGDESIALPAPALFDGQWDDRQVFQAGLLGSEQGVLQELPGASVYHLNLDLVDPTLVTGQMELLYTNQEDVPLDALYFHLFADQLGGGMTVANTAVNGQVVQGSPEGTALRLPLPEPLGPGEQAVISMDFETRVPQGESTKYNILAFDEGILALAHFYPMVAVYDDQGWHTEASPPHGDETYGDTSFYLVRGTAAADQVIAASGVVVDSGTTGQEQTVTIAAGPMRDFYLAMSDQYEVISETAGQVMINSYAPADLQDGARFALEVTAEALQSFSERYGPYPFSELDIVSTPTLALGVEYPGIFANALRIYDLQAASSSGLPHTALLESTTAHETAHQWFYSLVGNDQLNEPWLDEALTQYATWQYYIDRYGAQNAQGFYDNLEGRWARTEFAAIPIGLPAEDYSGQEYGAIVYGRGPIFLDVLAETMGQETFDAFLRHYSDRFRWQIATTADFKALAEQACECDLTPLFDEWVYANSAP